MHRARQKAKKSSSRSNIRSSLADRLGFKRIRSASDNLSLIFSERYPARATWKLMRVSLNEMLNG